MRKQDMFNKARFDQAIFAYKKDFRKHWEDEKYKWEAIKQFQDNWDIDASSFHSMLEKSTEKAYNLLTSAYYFPRGMLLGFAKDEPEKVREMFRFLFNETVDVEVRVSDFIVKSEELRVSLYGDTAKNHYQNTNSISTYLWLQYPDKYYIYKYSEFKSVARYLNNSFIPKKSSKVDQMVKGFKFYDELCNELKNDNELISMFESYLLDDTYKDPEHKTLTIDFGYYISHHMDDEKVYWWFNVNPSKWSFTDLEIGEEIAYDLFDESGNKRQTFQNFLDAKQGDEIVGYELSPVQQAVALGEVTKTHDEKFFYFKKIKQLGKPVEFNKLTNIENSKDLEYLKKSQDGLFKINKGVFDFVNNESNTKIDILDPKMPINLKYSIEDFLLEVFINRFEYDSLVTLLRHKKNLIFQGAPGVGKTFAAKRLAYSIIGEKDDSRIETIQFHQNFSYEDFVMGYKPKVEGFELEYGIFYKFCQRAINDPDKDYFFIIDEINRGNLSKIFGELLMLIEKDYRGVSLKLAYDKSDFCIPKNVFIIGMMNTADRSLAMIDYALRRRFSFYEMVPGFKSEGFKTYQQKLDSEIFNNLISQIENLNKTITEDSALGKGFRIGHSYFCGSEAFNINWLRSVVDYEIIPMLQEYWFDDEKKLMEWTNKLKGVFDDE